MELDKCRKFKLSVTLRQNSLLVKKQIDIIDFVNFRNHYKFCYHALQDYYNESIRRFVESCITTYLYCSDDSQSIRNIVLVDNSSIYILDILVSNISA